MTNSDIVAAQVNAYNAQDLDLFMSFYSEDCLIADLNGEVRQRGRAEIRERFSAMFARYPQNRCWIVHRFEVGDHVIDHEQGERAPGGESFNVAAIYTMKDGRIVRLDMAR